jgi:hypothetical protein
MTKKTIGMKEAEISATEAHLGGVVKYLHIATTLLSDS